MKRNFALRYIAYLAVFTALVFVATIIVVIPMPTGVGAYLNFGDVVIFVASSILGPLGGFICGGVGSALADVVYAPTFALLTFIVKGLEGILCGTIVWIFKKYAKNEKIKDFVSFVIAFIVSGIWMMLGYYVGTGLMLGAINEGEFISGFGTALLNIPNDSIQASVSVVVGYLLTIALLRIKYVRGIQDEIFSYKRKKKEEMPTETDENQ